MLRSASAIWNIATSWNGKRRFLSFCVTPSKLYRPRFFSVYQRKQMGRYHTMRKERFKQFMEGKLDRPYTKNPPAIYEAWTDYYHHNPYAGPKMYN